MSVRPSGGSVWDVVVAGAGPAGCHAAWELGNRGWHVLLLDRAAFPRWKPCAGGITVKAAPFIPHQLHRFFERTIHETVISYGPGRVTRLHCRKPIGWMVHREEFDRAHFELVRDLDTVTVMEETAVRAVEEGADTVRVETSSGAFHGRALVGADGVESVVAKTFKGWEEREFVAAFELEGWMPSQENEIAAQIDFGSFPGGYGWAFPKRNRCSIGGYVGGAHAREVRQRCQQFLSSWEDLNACEIYRQRGYRLPLGGTLRSYNTSRIVLVGDAADAVDPVTGEGIAQAFRTAHLAAGSIDRFLRFETALDGYSWRLWRTIHGPFRLARKLSGLMYDHPLTAFGVMFRNRLLCKYFVRVIRGEMNYAGLLARAALAAPLLPGFHCHGNDVVLEVP
jgi:geranylgeranyl reductase family protein